MDTLIICKIGEANKNKLEKIVDCKRKKNSSEKKHGNKINAG